MARLIALCANLSLKLAAKERQRIVSLTKIHVINAAQLIGRQAIQLHGGIGMTNEYLVAHAFKRLLTFETYFDDKSYHQRRVLSQGY